MHTKAFTTIIVSGILVVSAIASEANGIVKGKAVPMGKGKAWSWVRLTDGKPTATGVSFTDKALTGLPTNLPMPDMPGMPGAMPSAEYLLDLPPAIKGLPYDHVALDWNPKGHDPMQFYGVPHFDVHFYVISQTDRSAITAVGDDVDRCNKKPDGMYIPAGYILPPGTMVPNMGVHWIDPSSPELHGKPFTTTFIYGSYDGKTAFYEPMIALSYLQTKPNFSQDLKMPKAFDRDGYYPTRYSVAFDKKHRQYSVTLENLAQQKAGVMLNSN